MTTKSMTEQPDPVAATDDAGPKSCQRKGAIDHLTPDMRAFYRKIARQFSLGESHKRLLVAACESHDRMSTARDILAKEGLVTTDRHGQARPHPCVSIERDSRIAFARLLRELGLQDDAPEAGRPPRLRGRYEGRA
jgi:P27 family predicted phage terminase small subunit